MKRNILAGVLILSLILNFVPTAAVADNSSESCTCTIACAEGAVDQTCTVCASQGATACALQNEEAGETNNTLIPENDIEQAAGAADNNSMCVCTTPCSGTTINTDCPICTEQGAAGCKAQQDINSVTEEPAPEEQLEKEEPGSIENENLPANNITTTAATTNVSVTVDGITYTADFDSDARTATVKGIANPATQTDVTIPEKITYEGTEYTVTVLDIPRAWSDSARKPNVTALILPKTLTTVDGSDFNTFPRLTTITIPGSVKNFDGSFQNMENLRQIVFEEGVQEISAGNMIYECSSLTEIKLPASLQIVSGAGAFSGATALTTIKLPDGIQFTEGAAFSGDTALTSITLPASVTKISREMFKNCTSLQTVTAQGTITEIGNSAFSGATALTTIPDLSNVVEMGNYAFYECKTLTGDLDLSSLNEIPSQAFSYAKGIQSIKFSENLTSIGEWAFIGVSISEVSFPKTLETIGDYAFYYASSLKGTVEIPDSVTSLGVSVFEGTNVEEFVIGSGLTEIPAAALASDSLEEVEIDNSQDNVTIAEGAIPDTARVTFLQFSIDDELGDTISSDESALTLQKAVDSANIGDTITLSKHVKLTKAVTVPTGKVITITADDVAYQILGTKNNAELEHLFVVEPGASVTFAGKVVLSGQYNSGSIIENQGTVTLADQATVTSGTVGKDSSGIINTYGSGASFVMTGGVVCDNKIGTGRAWSGIIRITDGAIFTMQGGEIRDNIATDGNDLTVSSGVLLQGNAQGTMSDGTISGNTAHRGSAVMLYGDDPSNRTMFTMNGGTIANNDCVDSAGPAQASGAVHVQNNANFMMSGGTINGNTGGSGAGVCVVDDNLNMEDEYDTTFSMNGGTISNNKGDNGGGIYSYSNGVVLYAGNIIGNTATGNGGGVYSEGNTKKYSTMQMFNVLVTNNMAQQGGGMWFCATGSTTVHVTKGAAVFGNSAQDGLLGSGAGDDFVFTALRGDEQHSSTLANRILGGGAAQWYEDGRVYLPAVGLLPSIDPSAPRYGQEGANPEPVTVENSQKSLALKAIVSESAQELAKSEARLIIQGNTATRGGGIGANGGIIIGEPKTTEFTVTKVWQNDTEADRPEYVRVDLLNGETVIETVELTAENNWQHTFTGLPVADALGNKYVYSIKEHPVAGYTTVVTGNPSEGFTITNTRNEPGDTTVDVSVEKEWILDDGGHASDSVTVALMRNGQEYDRVVLSDANDWKYIWRELDEDVDWRVVEVDVPEGFHATVDKNGMHFTITNNDIGKGYDSVKVNKKWVLDDGGTAAKSVTVQLMCDGEPYGRPITLNASNNWSHLWQNLPEGHTWSVVEVNVPEGFDATISQNGNNFTITNDDIGEDLDSVKVNKEWIIDDGGTAAESVTVQLMCDGEPYGEPITLNDANDWEYIWQNLPKGHTWSVVEVNVSEGFNATVSQNGNNFTITNDDTLEETENIKVEKKWVLDDGGTAAESVTVQLMCDGEPYGEPITLNDDNDWTYLWENLPTGHTWTVEEVDVPDGFKVTISQEGDTITITNDDEEKPEEPGEPNEPNEPNVPSEPDNPNKPGTSNPPSSDTPKTGDPTHNGVLFAVCLAGLAGMVTIGVSGVMRRRRNDGNEK